MNTLTIVHLLHIIVVGTLFLYVGIKGNKIPQVMYPGLLILGIFIILYHLFVSYKRIQKGTPIWANLIHICIVGPLLIYIGYNNINTKQRYYEILLMLGFAAIGYHGYYLFF